MNDEDELEKLASHLARLKKDFKSYVAQLDDRLQDKAQLMSHYNAHNVNLDVIKTSKVCSLPEYKRALDDRLKTIMSINGIEMRLGILRALVKEAREKLETTGREVDVLERRIKQHGQVIPFRQRYYRRSP